MTDSMRAPKAEVRSLRSQVAGSGRSPWTSPASERIAQGIEALASPGELTPTRIPALSIYSWRGRMTHLHLVYKPSLCVVVRGKKHARVGDLVYRYDPAHFFLTAVPLPAELEVKRDRTGALVGMVLELELEQVARVALEIDDAVGPVAPPRAFDETPAAAFTGRIAPRLLDALERLLCVASDPVRHRVLEGSALREVLFELLIGPEGPALRQALRRRGGLRALIDVVRYMDEHSHEPMSVRGLARRAAMSESLFFAKFRSATGATPLQYLKSLRLTKARVLLSMAAGSVTEVAHSVGYASGSQFSRDFRSAFGRSPSEVLRHGGSVATRSALSRSRDDRH